MEIGVRGTVIELRAWIDTLSLSCSFFLFFIPSSFLGFI